MSIKIPIETSARHLHISQEDFEKLFGEGSKPHFIKELSQPGQYLCQERVTVKGPKVLSKTWHFSVLSAATRR
jgi:putative phosphotransacetylase